MCTFFEAAVTDVQIYSPNIKGHLWSLKIKNHQKIHIFLTGDATGIKIPMKILMAMSMSMGGYGD